MGEGADDAAARRDRTAVSTSAEAGLDAAEGAPLREKAAHDPEPRATSTAFRTDGQQAVDDITALVAQARAAAEHAAESAAEARRLEEAVRAAVAERLSAGFRAGLAWAWLRRVTASRGATSRWPRTRRAEAFAEAFVVGDDDRATAESDATTALEGVRKRADAWRTGTATVLGLITATLVVTDLSTSVHVFGPAEQRVLGSLLLFAALFSLAGLAYFLRAANGPSWLDTTGEKPREKSAYRIAVRARAAAYDLHRGQVLLFIGVAAFVGLVALTWMWEPA